jgi:hypothetical protein
MSEFGDVATCATCGAPLLQRTDDDGRTWINCTGEHGWMRTPFLDADFKSEEWREQREQELVRVRALWDHSQISGTTRFNEYMREDAFVLLGDGQAVLVAIGALEEDEQHEAVQAESFSVAAIAAKLGWSIGRTLDGLSLSRERELVEIGG